MFSLLILPMLLIKVKAATFDDYVYYNKEKRFLIEDNPPAHVRSHELAREECIKSGGQLAVLDDAEQFHFVNQLLVNQTSKNADTDSCGTSVISIY